MRFGGILLRLVVAVLGLMLIGGCSDPEPREPKATAFSPTPTITVPTMPAQAKENSPEGAAAFVKHYIDVFNYASSTGDVTELSRLSSPKCAGCQAYVKLYRDTYKAGGYFKGSDWKPGAMHLDFGGPESYIDTHVKASNGLYKKSRGDREEFGNGEDSDLSFGITIVHSEWRVTQLGLGKAK